MKKALFVFALVASTVLSMASCKSKDKCDAYRSSTPSHHKTVRY